MTKRQFTPSTTRFAVMIAIFCLLGAVLAGRLFQVQIMMHEHFLVKAETQYGLVRTVPADRGAIKTSDGYDLAGTQPAYMVYVSPRLIKDPSETATKIIDALELPKEENSAQATGSAVVDDKGKRIKQLTNILSNEQRDYAQIARKIDISQKQKLEALDIPGLGFQAEEKRYYPEGTLASQVLGFVGSDSKGNDKGYYGIEGYFDRELRGKDGTIALQKDAAGNPIPVGTYHQQPVEPGATITLTINRSLQYMVEQKLKAGVEEKGAESGSAILMEPDTGRILAMANYPTYNPSDWQDAEVYKKQLFRNSAIQDNYEPGSVMKSFTTATGLELGIITPQSTFDSHPYKVGDHTITTADHKYWGESTVTAMLEHSDNTVAAQIGMKIGRDNFLTWLHKIGLDRPTGITLEGEASGQTPLRQDWLPITVATASFGQGVSVTPLQLLEMMATIANDGVQMKPTIIQSIDHNGRTTTVKPESVGRVYSQKTTDQMTAMLKEVVEKGEFHRLALQGYRLAGKTSTSQIPIQTGGYDPNNVITTFVGYAPAEQPKFIMLVKLNKPKVLNSAVTVVPVWMNMATELFRYYGIAPEKIEPTPPAAPTPTPVYIP